MNWRRNLIKESQSLMRRVYGVDFSGAKDAGKKIWIASGIIEEGILQIEACCRAEKLVGSGRNRDLCLAALRVLISGEKNCIFGLDFPFGLPRKLIKEKNWEASVLRFPWHYQSPDDFRAKCSEAAPDRELKRITDKESKTPFSPYNLRVYRQTYYGIRDVLQPLLRDHLACFIHMQKAQPDKPWILEVCPASTLKRLLKLKKLCSYKGSTDMHYAVRARILEALEKTNLISLSVEIRAEVLEDDGGDALDSVIAAYAAFQAICNPAVLTPKDKEPYLLEGYVFC